MPGLHTPLNCLDIVIKVSELERLGTPNEFSYVMEPFRLWKPSLEESSWSSLKANSDESQSNAGIRLIANGSLCS